MRLIIFFLLALLYSFYAQAIETIEVVGSGRHVAMPIAINEFNDTTKRKLSNTMLEVVQKDLESCGLFRLISKAAFIEKKIGLDHEPLFASWRSIQAKILVNGQLRKLIDDKYEVSFVVWDIIIGKNIIVKTLQFNENSWRQVAHKIADYIYKAITGEEGYFDTMIAYIAESGPQDKRVKRLALMDQDGANHHFLTDGKNITLTPKFSPQNDKLLYLSFHNRVPRVFIRDIYTGKESLVGDFPGISIAPRFSPDGNKGLISIALNGVTNIYELDFKTKKVRKLTDSFSINTSPSYSPDGKYIVFNSDRGGSRQLYIMNADGRDIRRISFGSGAYAEPCWSPRGDYIAFTKMIMGRFFIGIMRPDGSSERIITSSYRIEGPCWSPNGRKILFFRTNINGKKETIRLYTIDLTGYHEREIETPYDASDPNWSRKLN